jgi:hypothetical protein
VVTAAAAERIRARLGLVARVSPLALFVAVNVVGAPYYLLSPAARLRSSLHPWLKPSGYVGQSAGILAFAIFAFLWLLPLRKKLGLLAKTGSVRAWLDLHVKLGLYIPLLLVIHAAWRANGIVALGATAMNVVVASGLIGRYLYTRIPRHRDGAALSRTEVAEERQKILAELAEATGIEAELLDHAIGSAGPDDGRRGALGTVIRLVRSDTERRRNVRALTLWLEQGGTGSGRRDHRAVRHVRQLARRELALTQQERMLDAAHRAFRVWHVAHRPIALTALLVVGVHVVLVVALGVTWLW